MRGLGIDGLQERAIHGGKPDIYANKPLTIGF
jgi:hypothetical protein